VTEPQPVMEQAEQEQLTRQVGRALLQVAGDGWQQVRAEYRSAGRHIEVDVFVTGPDGTPRTVRPPMEVVDGLGKLRQGMYRPGRGTWMSALYLLEPPSSFSAEFEPDVEPRWRRVPPPIGFADELRFFPRAEEHIPDWLRQRAGMRPPGESTPPGGTPEQSGSPQPGGPAAGGPAAGGPAGGPGLSGGQAGEPGAAGPGPGPSQPGAPGGGPGVPGGHPGPGPGGPAGPGGPMPGPYGEPGRPNAAQPGGFGIPPQHGGGPHPGFPPQGPPQPGMPPGGGSMSFQRPDTGFTNQPAW
jgi:hypothetical protein